VSLFGGCGGGGADEAAKAAPTAEQSEQSIKILLGVFGVMLLLYLGPFLNLAFLSKAFGSKPDVA